MANRFTQWLTRAIGGGNVIPRDGTGTWMTPRTFTYTGKTVTPETAMKTATVFACVRVIAETISASPMHVYERTQGRRQGKTHRVADDHPLQRLVNREPNPECTRVEFWEYLAAHLELRGNAFCEIERNNGGDPIGLWPMHPDYVRIRRDSNGRLVYLIRIPGTGEETPIPQSNMLHIKSMSLDGLWGISPISAIAQTIGQDIAATEFEGRVFAGDGLMRQALKTPQTIRDRETLQDLKETWSEAVGGGLRKAHRLAILHSGLEPVQIGISPKDAQLLELKSMTRKDIIRAYRIPPHKVGDMDAATFTNIEHQGIEFRSDTALPRTTRIAAAMDRALLNNDPRFFINIDTDWLLQGDFPTRMQGYVSARQNGILSANEIREMEGLNPYDGGDAYYIQLNMTEIGGTAPPPEGSPGSDGDPDTRQRETRNRPQNDDIRDEGAAMITRAIGKQIDAWQEDVLRAVERYLTRRDAVNWDEFIEDWGRNARTQITERTRPAITVMAKAIAERAAALVGGAVPDDLNEYAAQLALNKGAITFEWSLRQLEAIRAKEGTEYVLEDIAAAWRKAGEQHAQFAGQQTAVAVDGDISRHTWQRNGVTKLQWVASGSETCGLCQELDGRIVGIESFFANQNDAVDGDEGQTSLRPSGAVRYPPLHDGCVCSIQPVSG